MHFKIHLFVYFALLLVLIRRTNAYNITSLLGKYPDFSTFNSYLTQTNLAGTINSRSPVTILVVSNDAISPISGKPQDVLKKIMSVHVVLSYLDTKKLQGLNKSEVFTNLFQTTGGQGKMGFLNFTVIKTNSIAVSSEGQDANLGATVVKDIASEPYNISVIQISTVIVPQGIDNSQNGNNSTSPPPPPPPPNSPHSRAPAPSRARSPPAPAPASPPRPARSPTGLPPRPARRPGSPGYAPRGSPPRHSRSPAGSPPVPADAPLADAPGAEAPEPTADHKSGGGNAIGAGPIVAFTIALTSLCLMAAV